MSKPVSIGWQVMATIFIPTGLYAFKRINKLHYGGLIYLGTFGLYVLIVVAFIFNIGIILFSEVLSYVILSIGPITSFIFPMYFIAKWSKDWNEKLKTKISSQDAPQQT